MRKKYNIRWTDADNQELRRIVKNYNAKITRLEKKNPELKNALPQKTTVKQMREFIETRQDFNRELNSLQRFSKRGAEELVNVPGNKYNLKITKWQKEEMTRRAATINRRRKKRREEIFSMEATSRGEGLGYTVGDIGMGAADENALKPINAFTPSMTRVDLMKKDEVLRNESRDSYWTQKEIALKNNVIKGILANYQGEFAEDAKAIADAIDQMPFDEFYRSFTAETGEMEDISPPPGKTNTELLRSNIKSLKAHYLPNYKPEE